MINFFELFGFKDEYEIDKDKLEDKYLALQMQHHPDRAVGKPDAEKQKFLQKSADINEAYQVLSDDVKRAESLLESKGILVNKEKNNTHQPSHALLSEQMELRELAADIETGMYTKAEILERVKGEFESSKADFNGFYKSNKLDEAAEAAIRMKYLQKLEEELEKYK